MTRNLIVALVLGIALATVPIAAADVQVSVSSVEVTPQQPLPGETFTVTPTIRTLDSSSATFVVDAVALRPPPDSRLQEFARVTDVGTLSPGSSLSIPMSVTFDDPGLKNLRVHVYGENGDNGQRIHIRYPVAVRVVDQHPQVDVDVDNPVAGVDSATQVTVANGLERQITNVELTVDARGGTVENPRTVFASLGSGEQVTRNLTVTPDDSGPMTVETTLSYQTEGGAARSVTETSTVDVDALSESVSLQATPDESGSAIEVDVLNRGNTPVERVVVTGDSPNATVRRAVIDRVGPGESRTAVVNTTLQDPTATVSLSAEYEIGTRTGTASTTATLRANSGSIGLTGLDVTREGEKLHITGSASNLGLTEANSVVVSVVETDAVTPAFPSQEFFVGTVPPSDFVSFDVYATVEGDTTTIPLRVEYLVDGDREQRLVRVDASSVGASEPTGDTGGGGLLVPVAIGAVVVLGVGALIVVAWRNSRGGA